MLEKIFRLKENNNPSTLVSMVSFTDNFSTSGISALLAILGTIFTVILYIKKVKGSILIGILATWLLGIICQITGIYTVDNTSGYYTLIPKFEMTDFSKLGETFGQCFNIDFNAIKITEYVVVVFAFLFVDLFLGEYVIITYSL
jgi:AGZA family xanthine/uracil permease-like MFS transporter